MATPVLALYDCRSKQEYIYRTNRMKEISGGSAILAELFSGFFSESCEKECGVKVVSDTDGEFTQAHFDSIVSGECDGAFLYEGGGNLLIMYSSKENYIKVNQALSLYALKKAYTLGVVASCTEITGDFNADRTRLYSENAKNKNRGSFLFPCKVLPFTQIDRLTYMPLVEKKEHRQYTRDSLLKEAAYSGISQNGGMEILVKELDDMTEKNEQSLLAIIYVDGNAMGEKVKNTVKAGMSYAESINALRQFSQKTNEDFVLRPIEAITAHFSEKLAAAETKKQRIQCLLRKVIAGGDEITLVCSALAVPDIIDIYFNTLKESGNNSACMGVAVFHSHSPFASVYRLAEQCCESGKEFAHLKENAGKSYIDFHFVHSGITNDLETLREEQNILTRPYEFTDADVSGDIASWQQLVSLAEKISVIGRANIKDLGSAIHRGDTYYKQELERISSRYAEFNIDGNDERLKRMLADIAAMYDVWFSKEVSR